VHQRTTSERGAGGRGLPHGGALARSPLQTPQRLRHIPVIMISAVDEIDSVIRCIELGAEDYLAKPFNPTLLRARVGACLERKRLHDQVTARTRELSESLEQQTATAEVLRVISSSPGELEPVFQTMLEHAVRICEAKFGMLYLYDGDAFHAVSHCNAPPAFVEDRKGGPIHPDPRTAFGSVKQGRWCKSPTLQRRSLTSRAILCMSLPFSSAAFVPYSWFRCSRRTN
jgi:response regulator receiver domain-containing protein